MRSLCLLLVVALACAFTVQDHNNHIAATMRGLKQHLSKPHAMTTSSGHQLQGLTECVNAIQTAQAIQCEVFNIFNDSYTFTYDELNTIIGAHCDAAATSCSSRLETALLDVLVQCEPVIGNDPSLWIGIGALLVANKVPCLNDNNGHWCFAEFKLFLDRLSTSETNPLTATDLEAGCTDCTAKVLLAWIAFEPSFEAIYSTSQIDIVCSRVGTEWCILTFQQALAALTGATDAELVQRAPIYCKPCTFIYLFKWRSLIDYANNNLNHALDEVYHNATNVVLYMGWLCVKDPTDGSYCNAQLTGYDFDTVGAACAGSATAGPNGGPGCSSQCRSEIRKVIADLGCCLDTWLDLLTWICFNSPADCTPDTNPVNIRAMITVLCGLEIPIGCQRRRALEARVQIENLGWLWCQANMPQCLQLVHIAIAQQFFMDVADLRNKIVAANLEAAQPVAPPVRRLLQMQEVTVNVGDVTNSVGFVDASNQAPVVVSGTPGAAKATLDEPTQTRVLSATVKESSAAGLVPSISLALLALLIIFV
jgi:hypothetical protein